MFKVGDRVVYPMHGAGIIEAVEEREIGGTVEKYYVIRLSMGEMKIMVPVANVDLVGVREVIGKDGGWKGPGYPEEQNLGHVFQLEPPVPCEYGED